MPERGFVVDLLTATAIEFPCAVCGGRRAVTLRQILVSQGMLAHEGCVAPQGERECPPATFAPLVDGGLLGEFEDVWRRLDERAQAMGGQLSLRGAETPRKP
jgi:hypothetical protein